MRFRSTLLVEGVWLGDGRVLKPGSVTGRSDSNGLFPITAGPESSGYPSEQVGEFVLMRFGRRIVVHGELDEAFTYWHLAADAAAGTRTRTLLSSGVPTPGQHYRQEPGIALFVFDRYVLAGATLLCDRMSSSTWGRIEPRPLRP